MWNRLFGPKDPPEAIFWEWFAENSARYRNFEINGPEQDKLIHELDRRLKKVHRGIHWVFDSGKGETREFILSADGMRDLIPVIQNLVAAAPLLPGWKIIAFRPRLSPIDDISLEVAGSKIEVEDLWFALRPEGDRIGVELYLPGVETRPEEGNYIITFLMLDNALGEFDVMTRVGEIHPRSVPSDPIAANLKPFRDFPGEFDALYRLTNGI